MVRPRGFLARWWAPPQQPASPRSRAPPRVSQPLAPKAQPQQPASRARSRSPRGRPLPASRAADPPAEGPSANLPLPVRRADGPPIHPYSRGARSEALAIAADPVRREQARASFVRDAYAASSAAARASRAALWRSVLSQAGVPDSAPLTPEIIALGASILRAAGYRSAMLTVYQAVSEFVDCGGVKTPAMQQALARARRSCERGLGPPKHCAAFPLGRAGELGDMPSEAVDPTGPCHPARACIVGAWWLVREIELGNATVADVTFEGSLARWNLPVSKADPQALGASRAHECACRSEPGAPQLLPSNLCPACLLRDQVAFARTRGGAQGPLFPNPVGDFPSKAGVVASIRAMAKRLNLPLRSPQGAPRWGGHALRRGGAQYFAAAGVELWRIQALARHSSAAILGYLDQAHVAALGSVASEAAAGGRIRDLRCELQSLRTRIRQAHMASPVQLEAPAEVVAQAPNSRSSIRVPLRAQDLVPLRPAAAPGPPAASSMPPFILGGLAHRRDPSRPEWTLCAWHWTASRTAQAAQSPGDALACLRCAKRGTHTPAATRSCSSSSSASSDDSSP